MKPRVLILSGPTHEYFDPVRFIGNASSGKMGLALAREAMSAGYEVDFVTGPVAEDNLPALEPSNVYRVTSATDMLSAATPLFEKADIIIFAAAVADYSPKERCTEKMAKSTDDLVLELSPTPDIAKTLCRNKGTRQTAIGFALQTSDGEAAAQGKLDSKNFDGIVLNTPATLGAETGSFSYLSRSADDFERWGCIGKAECAEKLFQAISAIRPSV